MKHIKVREIMTPLERYTTISHEATLREAFAALEGALRGSDQHPPSRPRDFAVLVVDDRRQVIGRLVVWDVLQGLETGGAERVDSLSMIEHFGGWSHPTHLVAKARQIRVKNLVKALHKEEFIDEEESLDRALEQLMRHRFLSLIVTRQGSAVGVLRVVDVFSHVSAVVAGGLS